MRNIVKQDTISIIVILVAIIFGVIYTSTIDMGIKGDGNEYILQAVSFQNHFTFGVTQEDLYKAQSLFYNDAQTLEQVYYMDNPMHPYGDSRYSNHYGSYSALVAPIMVIVDGIGVYPLWAFPITNLILWISALLVLLFCLKADKWKKLCLVLLTVFNPAFFYLDWTSSEIYIFSFVVIGLTFYYNKCYGRSIIFLCIAAMQNLGILPLAMMVGIDYIIERIVEYKTRHGKFTLGMFLKEDMATILPYGLCYIPGLMPIISNVTKFHTINLVADVAMEQKYILYKASAYLFDLNLGIFPYEPIILIAFIVTIILGLRRNTRSATINLIGVAGILYIVSNQLQINCGMQGIMRYNVWIVPIMYFYVIMGFDKNFKTEKNIGMILISVVQSGIVTLILISTAITNVKLTELEFAPWTKKIINIMPQVYNPTHGIFYSRATGVESYYNEMPVVYTTEDGYVRKILLSKDAEEVFYSNQWNLCDKAGNTVDKSALNKVSIDEGDYKYINITEDVYHVTEYKLGNYIYFESERYNAEPYVISGMSHREAWGCWTDGKQVIMLFCTDSMAKTINANIDIAGTFYQPQKMTVLVNDVKVYEDVVEGEKNISFSFQLPESGIIQLKILLPNAISPKSLDLSSDVRMLGLGLRSILLYSEEDLGY